jgi:uncharacterized protein with PQ loop repeat
MADLWEWVGWTGTAMLAACTFPQAWHTYKLGNAKGMSASFLWLWIAGSTFTLVYLLVQHNDALPVIAARILNYIPLFVMVFFMYRPRTPNAD